jgi:hypothetical protein
MEFGPFIDTYVTSYVFSIASIYEMRVRDWTAGPIIGFCCICYALAWVLYQVVGPNFPMETDKEAYLIPSNKPTPRGPCDLVSTKQPDGTVAIFAGSNEFWSDVSGQIDILTLDGTPVVTTRKSERGLLFSIEMFNLEKKLVAKISDNKSILIPKNYAYNKRSKDRSTITLFDDFDKEVLYVEYLNNRTVLITGVFTGPNGTTVAINDNEILLGFNHGGAGASCWANFPGGIKFDGGSIGM